MTRSLASSLKHRQKLILRFRTTTAKTATSKTVSGTLFSDCSSNEHYEILLLEGNDINWQQIAKPTLSGPLCVPGWQEQFQPKPDISFRMIFCTQQPILPKEQSFRLHSLPATDSDGTHSFLAMTYKFQVSRPFAAFYTETLAH